VQYTPNPYLSVVDDRFDEAVIFDHTKKKGRSARKSRKESRPGLKRLDPSLHSAIIGDLMNLLSEDPSYEARYLAETILSKYVGPETDPADVRASRAIDKWLATELRNRKTNWRIIDFDPIENDLDLGWVKMSALVGTIRKLIRKVLGDTPPDECLFGTYSNGASTSKRRKPGVIFRKFATQADVTAEAYDTVSQVVSSCETWRLMLEGRGQNTPRVVEGNVLFTVPKSTTIDRVAAKEPDLNCFVQKGIGDFIRRQLRLKAGIDLNNQSVNRSLAELGSRDGKLATLDLSSASDSVTTQLVYLLLPPAWAVQLDVVRSQRTILPDGTVHFNEMLSSMGNGFTFELESLLFWSIVKAACFHSGIRGRVSVYGDDIICPSSAAARIARLFNWFGFSVNKEKSFWKGRFRESCGGHYYRGKDVTPFYVKEPIATNERLVHFLNRLRKWSSVGLLRVGYYELWVKYSQYVDTRLHGGWNVDSPYALVSPGKPNYRLKPKTLPLPPSLLASRRPGWIGSEVVFTEQDVLQLGGYLYALRTFDGRDPRFVIHDVGGELGEVFFEDPLGVSRDTVLRVVGWTSERNTRPSWHSGQIPMFPEEYWSP
jgi:hypothetical protein